MGAAAYNRGSRIASREADARMPVAAALYAGRCAWAGREPEVARAAQQALAGLDLSGGEELPGTRPARSRPHTRGARQ